jgi:hypothetical protein
LEALNPHGDDVKLLGDNINTRRKSTETLIDASKEVVLGVNAKRTKSLLLSYYQNAVPIHDVKISNVFGK